MPVPSCAPILASGITGEITHVDAGSDILGMTGI